VAREAVAVPVVPIIVTIIAGPLNYLGVNPKVTCSTPQPSG